MHNSRSALQLIRSAAAIVQVPAIETLRARAADNGSAAPYSVDQLRRVVEGVRTGLPLDELAAASGLSAEDVVSAVVGLGTWLTHRHGKAEVDFVPSGSMAQRPLFVMAPTPSRDKGQRAEVPARLRVVELPQGFDPRELGRDVRASLGAVMAVMPALPELQRFMDRAWRPQQPKAVTYETISVVAFFARLGRVGDLADVNVSSSGFAQLVVDSYDLLEVARTDGIAALGMCLDAGTHEPEAVKAALAAARPLFDERLQRLKRIVEAVGRSDEADILVDRERTALARRIAAAPRNWLPAGVHELSDTAIRRIAVASGLPVERDFELERDVRARLVAAGRSDDADVLVPAAVNAIRNGSEEDFWSSLQTA